MKEKLEELLRLNREISIKRDSHNSHNPPSGDKAKAKRNGSLRKKSEKKTGGQVGHKGHNLKMRGTADEVVVLKSDYCSECGDDLRGLTHHMISKRQVLDIPLIALQCTEFQQMACQCPSCKQLQKADYPTDVRAPIQYGNRVIGLIVYLNVFQYVPYRRLKQYFSDILHHSISEGTIYNLLKKGATKAEFVYEAILKEIKSSTYVGSDETGIKVNGSKWWIWVWQNVKNTYLTASDNRGYKTVEDLFADGLPNAVVGSDRWAAQLKIESKAKQLCFPHLLRDLNYLIELEKTEWAVKFKTLLKKSLQIRKTLEEEQKPFAKEDQQAQAIENEMDEYILQYLDKKESPKTLTFQKAMLKHRRHLFTFLYNLEVPPDNNASERAIRNAKIKIKISGMFKSMQQQFCILRSVFDTSRKRQLDPFNVFMQILSV